MHPIHKHMSSRMGARKSDEKYDAKMAYDKNLSGKARLHYLENDIHDKGMSMKAPMDMKAPMKKAGKMSPADMKAPMKKESAKQEKDNLMKDNPVDKDASGRRPGTGARNIPAPKPGGKPKPGRKMEPTKPKKRKPRLEDFIEKEGKGRRYGK